MIGRTILSAKDTFLGDCELMASVDEDQNSCLAGLIYRGRLATRVSSWEEGTRMCEICH